MRTVYQLPDLAFDAENVGNAVSLVPEARSWRLEFRRSEKPNYFRSHLLDYLELEFSTGCTARIEGPYLWKFRDSIPSPFGSDDVGYLDDNPFGPSPTEDLLNRIRRAHDCFFRLMGSENERRPLRVLVDTTHGTFTTSFPPQLTDRIKKGLRDRLRRHFIRLRPACDEWLGTLIAQRLQVGRASFELTPDPVYSGMLRNTLVYTPFPPDLGPMTLAEMLGELDPKPDDPLGPTPTLYQRLYEWMERAGQARLVAGAAREDALFRELELELGWSPYGAVPADELVRTFRDSADPTFLEDTLIACWQRQRGKLPVETLIEGRAA